MEYAGFRKFHILNGSAFDIRVSRSFEMPLQEPLYSGRKKLPHASACTRRGSQMVSEGEVRSYADGEVIIHEGDPADGMFLVRSGSVEVYRVRDGHEVSLGILREGDALGEMALFDKRPRSASARARGETRLEYIDRAELRIRVPDPVVWRILQDMGQRLRDMDDAFAKLETEQASRQDVVASWSARRTWSL